VRYERRIKFSCKVGIFYLLLATTSLFAFSKSNSQVDVLFLPIKEPTFVRVTDPKLLKKLRLSDKKQSELIAREKSEDRIYLIEANKYYSLNKYKKSFSIYKKLSKQPVGGGDGIIEEKLAFMYENGLGTRKDIKKAIHFYHLAFSYLNLCNNSDHSDLFLVVKHAAMLGSSLSQLYLSDMYISGYGTLRSYIKGYAWLSVALAQGKVAENYYDKLTQTKRWLRNTLNSRDLASDMRSGTSILKANSLAKSYYNKAVLSYSNINMKSINKSKKTFLQKIKSVI